MKLWEKGIQVDKVIEDFTVGQDRNLDVHLAPFDVYGSLAHVQMLSTIGLFDPADLPTLKAEMQRILLQIQEGEFRIEDDVEDVHSQIELELTRRIGDIGKKIHSGRSRNDQVLVDLRLFFRQEIKELVVLTTGLFEELIGRAEAHKNVLLPGYTHLQIAMPSSFGLWFSAYAEGLADDLEILRGTYNVINQNPLGSAAGYGSSFPLNRTLTTELLGFEDLNYNVVYAQMGRGKGEKLLAQSIANIAATIGKMGMDACLYMSQNMGFITLPDHLTTGSSIMPHKKNPDVFEIIRGRCNQLQSVPVEIGNILGNLPSGYHRDLQITKEIIIPAIQSIKEVIAMTHYMVENMQVVDDLLLDERYLYLFSVEELNKKVLAGTPFRDAYKEMAAEIKAEKFQPELEVHHSHEGSIGNLCLDRIELKMQKVINEFQFQKWEQALEQLVQW